MNATYLSHDSWHKLSRLGLVVALGVGLVVLVGGITLLVNARNAEPQRPGLSYLTARATSTLTAPTQSPIMNQQTAEANYTAKEAAQQEENIQIAAARSGTHGVKPAPATGTSEPTWVLDPVETGISDKTGLYATLMGSSYDVTNKWRGIIKGVNTDVAGGAVREVNSQYIYTNSDQGIAVVGTWSNNDLPALDIHPSPYRCGPLEVAAVGPTTVGGRVLPAWRLLLVSTTKPTWFEFDAANRTWHGYGIIARGSYQEADPPCTVAPTPVLLLPGAPVPTAVPAVSKLK